MQRRPHPGTYLSAALVIAIIAATSASAQVTGFVGDLSLVPLEGAIVSVQATDLRTVTAADGTFSLPGATGVDMVVVAGLKGYYNGSATAAAPGDSVLIALRPVPQDDDPSYAIVSPETCRSCHPDQYNQWFGSPMSLGGVNTWVHDIYNGTGTTGGMGSFVYTRDSQFAGHNPNSECASCHQPEVWLGNPFGAILPLAGAPASVTHGVSCDICHKIADIDIANPNYPGIFPGIVTFTRPQGPAYDQVQYGVLGDTDFKLPSMMRSSYQPQLVAEVCAACHQDKNDPDEDGIFEEPNGVISEPTYTEWVESAFGSDINSPMYRTCVDCHMPPSGETDVCTAIFPPLVRDPATIRSHRIEGTTAEYLENAVELGMTSQIVGDTLEVAVSITNSLTGHHVPTGVTVRNMILLVEAWREGDSASLVHTGTQTVHDLGGTGDPAQGYYAGLPGKFYAKVNHNEAGAGPTFFTDAFGIQFDNRIPALATDATAYAFAVPAAGGNLLVRARLIYRRAFRFLVDGKQWTEDGHGNPLEDVLPPHYGHLMESIEQVLVAQACLGQPAGTSCSDGNPCNGAEVCDAGGACQPGAPLLCDDASSCTDDSCTDGVGCEFVANALPCDDGDACTTDDTCENEACVGGPSLDCDDGDICTDNACIPASGCSTTFNSAECDDGDACTVSDVCVDGTCVGGAPPVCDDGDPCTQEICSTVLGCVNAPEPAVGCFEPGKALFQVKANADPAKNQLRWKWLKGAAVAQADLGDPSTSTTYTICIYDSEGAVSSVATRLDVGPGSGWTDKNPKGWLYKDTTATQSGVHKAQMKAGSAGRSSVKVTAKSATVPMPTAVSPLALFWQDPSVVVQLRNDATPACWTSEFTPAVTKVNKRLQFKAKSP